MALTEQEIAAYLAAVLDQAACRATLWDALISRMMTLRQRGVSLAVQVAVLQALDMDPYQLNGDVIDEVIELAALGMLD